MKSLIGIVLLSTAGYAAASPVFLTCDTVWGHSNKTTLDFEVDEQKKTVNSISANFTEKSITYDQKIESGDVITAVFSRLSGEVNFLKGNELLGKGQCSIVAKKKF